VQEAQWAVKSRETELRWRSCAEANRRSFGSPSNQIGMADNSEHLKKRAASREDALTEHQLVAGYTAIRRAAKKIWRERKDLDPSIDVDDVIQSAFIKYLDFLQNKGVTPNSLFAYAHLVVRRTLTDWFRRASRRKGLAGITRGADIRDSKRAASLLSNLPDAKTLDPSEEAVAKEDAAMLWKEIEALPKGYRDVVMLRLDGLSFDQIASVLGTSDGALRVRFARALRLLSQYLASEILQDNFCQ